MKKTITTTCIIFSASLFAQNISFTELGRYTNGQEAACEISAYDATSKKLFITNAAADSIDIVNVNNPASPTYINGIDITTYGGGVNSVVNLNNGYFAAAIEANVKQDSGIVAFFTTNGIFTKQVKVGSLPDMLAITHNGDKILVANEGEPDDSYTVDPDGSIAIIDISGGITTLTQNDVSFINFSSAPTNISGSLKKPGTTWAQDLEPEYIAVSEDDSKAFVICQENNVMVIIDLSNNSILSYKGLGYKDHNIIGNGFDASDNDNKINITTYPIKGIYQPDAIYSFTVNNNTYVVSANEGDSRDYTGYSSETKISNLTLDPTAFPNAAMLQHDTVLGRLKTFTMDMIGDIDNDNDIDELYSYGARSFSIWDINGNLVWDSGDEIEQYMKTNHATFFNCNDGKSSKQDSRSDDKGPEPEAITIGKLGSKIYVFVGLERQGGILIYDVTNPNNPSFADYIHTMNSSTGIMTDIAPEGLLFVPASESHTGENLLIASNEVSGTVAIYQINDLTVGINDKENSSEINIYPNPVKNNLTINVEANSTIIVSNSLGQNIIGEKAKNSKTNLNVNNLAEGIYNITIITPNNKIHHSKFVKQ